MEESLFSHSWYRVAAMKPRLRSHVKIHRHSYRGEEWYVMQDYSTGKFHRFSPEAYCIIGLMNGQHTLADIWETVCETSGDDMPTQDELIGLVSRLYRADVLQSDLLSDVDDLFKRFSSERRNRRLNILKSPTSIKLPVFDPDKLLERTFFLVRPFFSRLGMVLWLAAVIPALFLVFIHWHELSSDIVDRVFGMENLILIWAVYPVLKLFHEFGHAYAVKKWGGEVHEMGLMFLVFVPMPYVDASSSTAFSDKRKRMLVGGAGILVEMFAAAVATFVWVNVEPGAVRAIAWNVMVIAGVSTLFFNGNPLLKFDAYYVFSDYLEIPNLAMRGNTYMGYFVRRYLLGIEEAQSPASAPGEAGWLGAYVVAAFVYRIFISIRIVMLVAGKFFFIGIFMALWAGVGMLVFPLFRVFRQISSDPAIMDKRGRIVLISSAAAGLLLLLLGFVPVPCMTVAQGVLWPPGQSGVYAGSNSFVKEVIAKPGQWVHGGEILVMCEDRELDAEVAVLSSRLDEFKARYRESLLRDRTEAKIFKDEMRRIRAELERAGERQKELIIRSPDEGIFLVDRVEDLPGRFVRRGDRIGYVVDFSRVTARVVVSQEDVDRVRRGGRDVEARLSSRADRIVPAEIKRIVPAASSDLPSLALSLEGGGDIALDPEANQEPRAFKKLFQLEIALADSCGERIGERVYIRFKHEPEPLAYRWYRNVRRLFLRRFDV